MSTPQPPGGYHPYGQPQQPPYGAPPQQGPYGQQPYPGQPPHGGPQMMPGPAPRPPRRPGSSLKVKIFAVVVALGIAAVWSYNSKGNTLTKNKHGRTVAKGAEKAAVSAEPGDCVENKGTQAKPVIELVECGSIKAEFKVVETDSVDTCPAGTSRYQELHNGVPQITRCLKPLEK
ncbi:hypothetical protein ACFYYR_09330 [Streptomyces sp. NPDC001922]|uniref:LppU/SCO3897 family protein n=1 Tax=Streptomyces sp. NPDC001922 TaxID=3364624 RepID=UPI0036A84912